MNRLFFLGFLIFSASATAQVNKPILFKEEMFDFGPIQEAGGAVVHEFMFTNASNQPVKILGVQASCGCTTPDWTKESVAPGKTGFIQASFNPKGRPGFFNKSLTVTTDADPTPIVLTIKGRVETGGHADASSYPISKGSWKLKMESFNLGKVYHKDEFTTRDFSIMNAGGKPVTFSGKVVGPAYLKAEVFPKTLAPGAKGNVKISYNGSKKGQYGFQSDNIELYTDDEEMPVKSFTVYATLEDYFPELSKEELAKAPKLRLGVTSMDFGRFTSNASSTREVVITNTGKKELTLRSLQGNCTCVVASAKKNVLKPGESTTIQITLSAQDRQGTQQKALTIYSNDPSNPVQRITLSGYVE